MDESSWCLRCDGCDRQVHAFHLYFRDRNTERIYNVGGDTLTFCYDCIQKFIPRTIQKQEKWMTQAGVFSWSPEAKTTSCEVKEKVWTVNQEKKEQMLEDLKYVGNLGGKFLIDRWFPQ